MNSVTKQLYLNKIMERFMDNFYRNKKIYCHTCSFNITHMKVQIYEENCTRIYKLKQKYRIFSKFFNKIVVSNIDKTVKFYSDDEIFIKTFL